MRDSRTSRRSPLDCAKAADAAKPANSQTATGSSRRIGFSAPVDELDAAVLLVGRLVAARRRRTLFTVAHRRKLGVPRALQHQGPPDGLRPPFGQRDVVLARTALVGVSLDADLHAARAGQELRMRVDERGVLRPDVAAVEVEIDDVGDALGPDRKSTRLNSSHSQISYAVFCLKK